MMISNEQISIFEDAIAKCRRSLFLLTPDGKQYDLN